MNVRELIEELEKLDQEADVLGSEGTTIENVGEDEFGNVQLG